MAYAAINLAVSLASLASSASWVSLAYSAYSAASSAYWAAKKVQNEKLEAMIEKKINRK
jgi:hypothetical protein